MIRRPRDWNRVISVVMILVAVGVGVPWLWHEYQTRPPWWDPVQHLIIHVGLKETLRMAALSVLGASRDRARARHAAHDPLPALARADPRLRRALARPADHRDHLPHLLRIPADRRDDSAHSEHPALAAFQAATVGLILWGSAQVAEATRGAVQSIRPEQHEAAAALGFGWVGRHVYVILPQAARRLLPPMIGLLVNVIQNTTIAALIGVGEVLETANRSTERLLFATGSSHAFAIFSYVMVVFFLISFPLTRLAAFLEKRLAQS